MKKFLILLIFAAVFTTLKSQVRSVNLEITLLSPPEGDLVQTFKPMDITARVKNLGPNNMTEKDTLIFTVRYDGDTVYSASKPLSKGFYIVPSGLSVNQEISSFVLWAGLIQNYNTGGIHTYCLDARLLNRNPTTGCSDPVIANNSGCHNVYVSIFNNGIDAEKGTGKIGSGITVSPVPCNNTANLSYSLTESAEVKVTITDMQGRIIMNAANEFLCSGPHVKDIDVSLLAPGIYFARLNADGREYATKFIKQ